MYLKITRISFPGFGIDGFDVNSVAFRIFGRPIAWYGIIITFGILLGCAYVIYRAKQMNIKPDDILDIALVTVPTAIVFARLYYVLTSLDKYDSFWDVFKIWEGGIAIYGAIGGGALAVILMSRKKKISFTKLADAICPAVMLGQILGRWGNFFNAEAHGTETTSIFRMGLAPYYESIDQYGPVHYYHPTFLYESLWNLLGFVLLNLYFRHRKYDGQVFYLYFAWYGIGRAIIEGLRTDSLYIFGVIRISQLVGDVCFVVFGALLIYNEVARRKGKKIIGGALR